MTKSKFKDLVERALWTFAQGFIAGWAMTNFQASKGALIGAVAAGLSAFKTFVKETL